MKSLEERLEQVKKDTNEVDDRNQALQSNIAKLENQKTDLDSEYEQKKLDQKNFLEPEIEKIKELIATRKAELTEGVESIEKQQSENKELDEKLSGLQERREDLNRQISERTAEQQKVSQEPVRIQK